MNESTIDRLRALFDRLPVLVGGAVPQGEIDLAEQALGVKFAPDYRAFLTEYGGAMVGSLPVLGLRRAEVMGDDLYSVIEVTRRFRVDGWKPTDKWSVISVDASGTPIGTTRVRSRSSRRASRTFSCRCSTKSAHSHQTHAAPTTAHHRRQVPRFRVMVALIRLRHFGRRSTAPADSPYYDYTICTSLHIWPEIEEGPLPTAPRHGESKPTLRGQQLESAAHCCFRRLLWSR